MIRWIEVKGLRALRYVSLGLDPFMVMVGPNACGKSTLFDALLILRDVLSSGLEAAVFGQARMNIAPRAVSPQDLTWLRQGGGLEIAVTLELPGDIVEKVGGKYRFARYELGIHTDGRLGFDHETLWLTSELRPVQSQPTGPQQRLDFPEPLSAPTHIVTPAKHRSPTGWRKVVSKVVESGNDYFRSETSDWNNLFRLGPAKSALANLPEDEVMVSVVLRAGASLTPEALLAHCNANMAYFMVPRFVEFVPALPRTMTEKVEKYRLRESAQARLASVWDREKAGVRLTR